LFTVVSKAPYISLQINGELPEERAEEYAGALREAA
jgi:hypothetical protein